MGDTDDIKKSQKKSKNKSPDEVICEFFGIKITTKNPNLARILTTDVGDIMRLDVRDVKDFITNDDPQESTKVETNNEINTTWDSLSEEIKEINRMIDDSRGDNGGDEKGDKAKDVAGDS